MEAIGDPYHRLRLSTERMEMVVPDSAHQVGKGKSRFEEFLRLQDQPLTHESKVYSLIPARRCDAILVSARVARAKRGRNTAKTAAYGVAVIIDGTSDGSGDGFIDFDELEDFIAAVTSRWSASRGLHVGPVGDFEESYTTRDGLRFRCSLDKTGWPIFYIGHEHGEYGTFLSKDAVAFLAHVLDQAKDYLIAEGAPSV